MAKRLVEQITVDGTDYDLFQPSSLSQLDNYVAYGQYSGSGTFPGGGTVNTNFATVKVSATGETAWATNLTKVRFHRYNLGLGIEQTISWWVGDYPYGTITSYGEVKHYGGTLGDASVYYAIVLDDTAQEAWLITYIKDGSNNYSYMVEYSGTAFYNAFYSPAVVHNVGVGGGASHVSKTTGLLSSLSQNISDILIVAGGGGGGGLTGTTPGNGGGYIGGSPKLGNTSITGRSGTQSTGFAFGQGEAGGGGGGFYGGLAAQSGVTGAGAGSGYIANSLLTGEKRMYGNNIPTSTDTDTYSISNGTSSSNPIAGYAKAGNGHVRFTYLREAEPIEGLYFFKPTFATGSDGHDTIRYNTNDLTYIFYGNSSTYIEWNPEHSTQPEKAYSGQLVDTDWSYPFSEAKKYDQLTIANNVLSLPYNANALWNFGPVESAMECFPAACTITINFDFWLNQTTNDESLAELLFFTNYENGSTVNTTDGQGTVIYYGSSADNCSIEFLNVFDENDDSIITAQEWHNFKVILQISNKIVTYYDAYLDNLWIEDGADVYITEFPNVIDGNDKCCFIGFRQNYSSESGIKIRDLYISYQPERTMNLLEGQYFFKPTFASGTDGHDLARYDPSDQFYSVNNLNNISVGDEDFLELYPNHVQPTKLYAGQLTDMTWAYYDDQYVAHPYTNSNRFDEFTVGNNKVVISSTAHFSNANALCWDFGSNMSQYKMIPRNCTITINCNMVASPTHFDNNTSNSHIILSCMYHEMVASEDKAIHIGGDSTSHGYILTYCDYPFEGLGNIKNVLTVSSGQVTQCQYYVNDVLKYTDTYRYEFPNVIGGTLQCCAIIISGLCPEDEISDLYISVTPTN